MPYVTFAESEYNKAESSYNIHLLITFIRQNRLLSLSWQTPSIAFVRHHPASSHPHQLLTYTFDLEQRRAAVALVLRVVPPPDFPLSEASSQPTSLQDFFELDWVNAPGARPELLFLRRQKGDSPSNGTPNGKSILGTHSKSKDSHVAFPGGRMEEGDEDGLYTAMRQTWEEIGLDLAERTFTCIGQLDDREITTSLGKRLLMVLSPF
ncbi:hypothetical protein FRC17_008690, partial [Serendipita sp. 399]